MVSARHSVLRGQDSSQGAEKFFWMLNLMSPRDGEQSILFLFQTLFMNLKVVMISLFSSPN